MLVGHQKQWQFLIKSAELGKLPHALLFYGQGQLGKKALAIEFVKYLNCEKVSFSKKSRTKAELGAGPCQTCRNCQDIQKGAYPDFVLVEPDPLKKEIQISQIRNLIGKLSLRPYSADFKVAILDKAHSMNEEAQSCFLKFLEEPRGKTLFILITEYPQLLFPTILSRVQKLRFFPIKINEIEKYLAEQGISKEKAKYFSSFSFGKPGLALNFLHDSQKLENQKKLISDLIEISNSDLAIRFRYAKTLSEMTSDGDTKREILDIWLRYFRALFISSVTRERKFGDFSQYSLSKIKNIIKAIQTTNYLISNTNTSPRLALEILLMKL